MRFLPECMGWRFEKREGTAESANRAGECNCLGALETRVRLVEMIFK